MDDLVEEVVAIAGHDIALLRPRDPDSLATQEAYERDEFLPYWAELWPSAIALARMVAARALHGARTLELGCGLGLPSLAAALAGGRVLATDWSPDAVAMTEENARRNDARLETLLCSWAEPDPIAARGPFDLVLASDVLYEARNREALGPLLPQLLAPRGSVWIAEPGRADAESFLAGYERREVPELARGGVYCVRSPA